MNTNMWEHEAVQRNLQVLPARGVGWSSRARVPGVRLDGEGAAGRARGIVAAAERVLKPAQTLRGATVVVSAGPTFEDIDPVRSSGNRSSGRMGYAVAAEAARRGAAYLVSGPTRSRVPSGVEVVRVRAAAEMRDAVVSPAPSADIDRDGGRGRRLCASARAEKIAKDAGEMVLRLARTPDILSELGERRARGELGAGAGRVRCGDQRRGPRAREKRRASRSTSSSPTTSRRPTAASTSTRTR